MIRSERLLWIASVFVVPIFFHTTSMACSCGQWLSARILAQDKKVSFIKVKTHSINADGSGVLTVDQTLHGPVISATQINARTDEPTTCQSNLSKSQDTWIAAVKQNEKGEWYLPGCATSAIEQDLKSTIAGPQSNVTWKLLDLHDRPSLPESELVDYLSGISVPSAKSFSCGLMVRSGLQGEYLRSHYFVKDTHMVVAAPGSNFYVVKAGDLDPSGPGYQISVGTRQLSNYDYDLVMTLSQLASGNILLTQHYRLNVLAMSPKARFEFSQERPSKISTAQGDRNVVMVDWLDVSCVPLLTSPLKNFELFP